MVETSGAAALIAITAAEEATTAAAATVVTPRTSPRGPFRGEDRDSTHEARDPPNNSSSSIPTQPFRPAGEDIINGEARIEGVSSSGVCVGAANIEEDAIGDATTTPDGVHVGTLLPSPDAWQRRPECPSSCSRFTATPLFSRGVENPCPRPMGMFNSRERILSTSVSDKSTRIEFSDRNLPSLSRRSDHNACRNPEIREHRRIPTSSPPTTFGSGSLRSNIPRKEEID